MKLKHWGIAFLATAALVGVPSVANAEPLDLPAPVATECVDGDVYASFDIPEVEGVFYGIYDYTGTTGSSWMLGDDGYNWQPGDDIIIIATQPDWSPFDEQPNAENPSGYDTAGSPGWWFENPCELVTVTPQAPVWTDPSTGNTRDGYWTAPEQEGVTYKVTRYSSGKVKIVASAEPGYVLAGTTQWQRIDR